LGFRHHARTYRLDGFSATDIQAACFAPEHGGNHGSDVSDPLPIQGGKGEAISSGRKNCDARASYDRLRGLSPECADDLCADMVQTDLCQAQGLLKLPIEWRRWPATRRHLRTIIHFDGQENGMGDQDVKRDEKDAAAFTTLV
jgi:hypothetical protein